MIILPSAGRSGADSPIVQDHRQQPVRKHRRVSLLP
jgi:hypothetical protein